MIGTRRPPLLRHERPLRVLIWPVHGNYLLYFAECGHDILVVTDDLGDGFDWPSNMSAVAPAGVAHLDLDVVVHQSRETWERAQHEVLGDAQRHVPRIYVEHDPPRQHPTDTRHPVDDPGTLLVHVTHFNRLMWDSGRTPTTVIEHGVRISDEISYDGSLTRGVVVVNGLPWRGRRLGRDLFETIRERVPLDLIGLESEELGGIGPIEQRALPALMSRYRFFFHPARYTSLGLAVLEAMTIGIPVVGLATTELPSVIDDGRTGYVSNDAELLVERMELLLADADHARQIGAAGQALARSRFGIELFAADWDATLRSVAGSARPQPQAVPA